MKKTLLILLTALVFRLPLAAADNHVQDEKKSVISWGAKLGFTSCSTYLTDAAINGKEFEEYTQDTQLGNFISVHMQYGYDKFFFQTSLGLSLNKSAFFVDLAEHNINREEPENLGMEYEMTSLVLPLQVGYSIVNQPPYRMSLYTGPCMRIQSLDRYVCNVKSSYNITETPRRFLFGGTFGFSVQTGRTFFDMQYEVVLSNISKQLSVSKEGSEFSSLTLGRRMGIFSFSYGILF